MEHKILFEVIILLASSVIAVALFKRLRLPPILSYFIVGIVIGPNALGWIPSALRSHPEIFMSGKKEIRYLIQRNTDKDFNFTPGVLLRNKSNDVKNAKNFNHCIFNVYHWAGVFLTQA